MRLYLVSVDEHTRHAHQEAQQDRTPYKHLKTELTIL